MTHLLKYFLIILLLSSPLIAFAQMLRGHVFDQTTDQPLEYVHIGILNKNAGTISIESGQFNLNIKALEKSDTIVFSYVGYESKIIVSQDLSAGLNLSIGLVPKTFLTPQIEISGNRESTIILGRSKTTKTTTGHSGTGDYGIGREWGLKIKYDDSPYYIKQVHFNTRFNTVDSVLFRVNVYRINGSGLPGKSLLKKPAYTKSYKKDKWIFANIIDQEILVQEDVIVTFETVRIWYRNKGKNQLFFTHGQGYEEGTTFTRDSSHDKWKKNKAGPIAMYITCIKSQ